jgi:hypothetical protein
MVRLNRSTLPLVWGAQHPLDDHAVVGEEGDGVALAQPDIPFPGPAGISSRRQSTSKIFYFNLK